MPVRLELERERRGVEVAVPPELVQLVLEPRARVRLVAEQLGRVRPVPELPPVELLACWPLEQLLRPLPIR